MYNQHHQLKIYKDEGKCNDEACLMHKDSGFRNGILGYHIHLVEMWNLTLLWWAKINVSLCPSIPGKEKKSGLSSQHA